MRYNLKILAIPPSALVVLIGAAGSGKTTFARTHFRPTEILSSDYFRGLVCDDEAEQAATDDAFDVLHSVLQKRLRRGKLCVVDATNVRAVDRIRLLAQAKHFGRPVVAIVLEVAESVAIARATQRTQRTVNAEIVRQQLADLSLSLAGIEHEGFDETFRLQATDDVQISLLDC